MARTATTAKKPRTAHPKLGAGRRVTLPADVVQNVRLRRGEEFVVGVEAGAIVIVPLSRIPKSQRWFWTPEWQRREREADEAIRTGKIRSFSNVADLLRSLRA